MRIKHIKVENFKSLVDFDLPLAKFSCLVGLNGSGKSTILQFFDFLSQQVRGDLSGWLEKRQWKASDLNSKLTRKQNINFTIVLSCRDSFENDVDISWSASFNRLTLRCTSENVGKYHKHEFGTDQTLLLLVKDGEYHIPTFTSTGQLHSAFYGKSEIEFNYQGSLISTIKESRLTDDLLKLKEFFVNLHALDLLSPELLRRKTRESGNNLGLGGEKLSAFLYEIGEEKRTSIQEKLAEIYPQLRHLDSSALRSGWKSLTVHEKFGDIIVKSEARHVADGLLRILAVFAQLSKAQSFLLLDEIENGVNPELIEFLVDQLVEAQPQVLITTHSPMVLNYIEDDIAIEGIIYIYKQLDGATKAIRLFDISSMRKKLEVMGPGEVYEDTLLTQLNQEISEMD
jgi:predicted ATPase